LTKFYERRVEQIRERLKRDDPELAKIDRPTDFLRYGFPTGQMRALIEAVLKDRPLTGVNDFPRPETSDPDAEGPRDAAVVKVWVRVEDPLEQTVYLARAEQEVGKRPALTTLSAQEAFMVYFKVCVVCGLVIGSPWIFWQIWLFVAAGLYPHEK